MKDYVHPIMCRPFEAPALFGISRTTLYRWIERGHIKLYKNAGISLVDVKEVTDFIKGAEK